MRTILTIASSLGCTALILTQKPNLPVTPLFQISEYNKIGYIDNRGKVVLPAIYLNGGEFSEGLAPVRLKGRYGFIDGTGSFVISPKFDWAESFVNGLAIVYEEGQPYYIDHSGNSPFPCHYAFLLPFQRGVARVRTASGKMGLIDRGGRLVADTAYDFIGDFNDGLSVVATRTPNGDLNHGVIDSLGHVLVRPGPYTNIKGKPVLLLNDSTAANVGPFANGRSFIQREDNEYHMIDTRLQPVGTVKFSNVRETGFINGYAIVQSAGRWGIVDTNARFVVEPTYDDIDESGIVNGYFFFRTSKAGLTFYGIATLKGNEICKPYLDDVDRAGFINGLIKVVVQGRPAFLNTEGELVWQAKTSINDADPAPSALKDLNVDYMMRGCFYAYSSPAKTEEGNLGGGWAISGNIPRKLTGKGFEDNRLSIVIDNHQTDTFAGSFNGFPVYVANTTRDTCHFHAQDSRLNMQMQALDREGNWKDIDYLPRSWCGNSYHIIDLEPGTRWKFVIPRFEGDIRTKLRIVLQYIDALHPETNRVLFSNIIEGNINPSQFWNKRRYSPQGLMDPYND